jgi:hypothetical protein
MPMFSRIRAPLLAAAPLAALLVAAGAYAQQSTPASPTESPTAAPSQINGNAPTQTGPIGKAPSPDSPTSTMPTPGAPSTSSLTPAAPGAIGTPPLPTGANPATTPIQPNTPERQPSAAPGTNGPPR